MVSTIYSMGICGIDSFVVKIESDISRGMPICDIVGLPDATVKESKNRVRSAICNSGFTFPVARITINLAPADIKKCGSIYDLPIFLSILKSSNQIATSFDDSVFIGELSLSGEVRAVSGIISMAIKAKKEGFKNIYVPYDNAKEASIIEGINVYGLKNVSELISDSTNKTSIHFFPTAKIDKSVMDPQLDFANVKGQYEVKRALEVAAAGGHNVIMIGPPGSGKSMMAKNMVSILPDMTFDEILETTSIHSITGMISNEVPVITQRPFRSPHHTISMAGISGGGTSPRPGELSLAHNGVLFLDEFPEFSRSSLESIRQPLEDGHVTISRVRSNVTYPCSIMLIAAMNPCPCGYYGHPTKRCTCSRRTIEKYLSKISGPILDRIDIHIEVPPISYSDICSNQPSESSVDIKKRVDEARGIQLERYKKYHAYSNARVPSNILSKFCVMSHDAKKLLENTFNQAGLSARGYQKILRVSRTLADMDKSDIINYNHVWEATQLRIIDEKYFSHHQISEKIVEPEDSLSSLDINELCELFKTRNSTTKPNFQNVSRPLEIETLN